jgi:hypothetical protein
MTNEEARKYMLQDYARLKLLELEDRQRQRREREKKEKRRARKGVAPEDIKYRRKQRELSYKYDDCDRDAGRPPRWWASCLRAVAERVRAQMDREASLSLCKNQ